MAAVRVPPSACRTSQSSTTVFSPSADTSMTPAQSPAHQPRDLVSPTTDPAREPTLGQTACWSIGAASRTRRSPSPGRCPCATAGRPSVTDAAHSTRVPPNSTSTDPSAWSNQPRVIRTGRSWSADRPSRRMPGRLAAGSDIQDQTGAGRSDRAAERLSGAGDRGRPVTPRRDMGDQQPADPGSHRVLACFPPGEVHSGRMVLDRRGTPPRRGTRRRPEARSTSAGVGAVSPGIRDGAALVVEAQREGRNRVHDRCGANLERADVEAARRIRPKVERLAHSRFWRQAIGRRHSLGRTGWPPDRDRRPSGLGPVAAGRRRDCTGRGSDPDAGG